MDATAIIVIIAVLACIVVADFLVYRSRARVSLKGPAGIGLDIDALRTLQEDTRRMQLQPSQGSSEGFTSYACAMDVCDNLEIILASSEAHLSNLAT